MGITAFRVEVQSKLKLIRMIAAVAEGRRNLVGRLVRRISACSRHYYL